MTFDTDPAELIAELRQAERKRDEAGRKRDEAERKRDEAERKRDEALRESDHQRHRADVADATMGDAWDECEPSIVEGATLASIIRLYRTRAERLATVLRGCVAAWEEDGLHRDDWQNDCEDAIDDARTALANTLERGPRSSQDGR